MSLNKPIDTFIETLDPRVVNRWIGKEWPMPWGLQNHRVQIGAQIWLFYTFSFGDKGIIKFETSLSLKLPQVPPSVALIFIYFNGLQSRQKCLTYSARYLVLFTSTTCFQWGLLVTYRLIEIFCKRRLSWWVAQFHAISVTKFLKEQLLYNNMCSLVVYCGYL